jgi:hypothetical protein
MQVKICLKQDIVPLFRKDGRMVSPTVVTKEIMLYLEKVLEQLRKEADNVNGLEEFELGWKAGYLKALDNFKEVLE